MEIKVVVKADCSRVGGFVVVMEKEDDLAAEGSRVEVSVEVIDGEDVVDAKVLGMSRSFDVKEDKYFVVAEGGLFEVMEGDDDVKAEGSTMGGFIEVMDNKDVVKAEGLRVGGSIIVMEDVAEAEGSRVRGSFEVMEYEDAVEVEGSRVGGSYNVMEEVVESKGPRV
ncbi:hypothetical protein NDU88_001134 [Pleurodeles waltl]|uniref:Uncharacterized protein n=1 Tax=Pleurodeles waltl TaxID=8319 RepID=A0AAV7NI46_PLEWA|nr:hypothetical protein NDU88_001134 [Pleurodeles waltl]